MSTPVDKTLRLDRTQLSQKKPSNRPPTMVLALIAGLAAAALVFFLLNGRGGQKEAVAPPPPPLTVPVIVAARDIPMHQKVTEAMLVTASVPKDQAPADGISTVQEAIGKVTVSPILAKQTITRPTLTDPGINVGLSFAIPAGMRAVTIALDSLSSVAGFVKPHDHVDVVGTFDAGQGQSVTRTVLQDIELLATGSQVLPDRPIAPTNSNTPLIGGQQPPPAPEASQPIEVPNATVLVTPTDAQKLILSASKGKLQLSLRPSDDVTRTPLPTLRSSAVTGATPIVAPVASIPRPVPAPVSYTPPAPPLPTMASSVPPAPVLSTITVIRGSDTKSVTVAQ